MRPWHFVRNGKKETAVACGRAGRKQAKRPEFLRKVRCNTFGTCIKRIM